MLRQLKAPGKLEMCQKPYERLYVYQVEGVVSPGLEQGLGPFFLGNWVEGNCSFLFFSRPAMNAITTLLEKESSLNLIDTHEFTYEAWHGGGLEPFEAARLGVYLHGLAADMAVSSLTVYSLTASDLLEYLPVAISQLQERVKA